MVSEDRSLTGDWWLPHDRDVRRHGRLQRRDDRWRLVLGGGLPGETDGPQLIHGRAVDGRAITVIDAQWRRKDVAQTIWDAPAYLDGVHLPSLDSPLGTVEVQIAEAAQFLDHEPEMVFDDPTLTVWTTRRNTGPVQLSDGTSLEIAFESRAERDDAASAVALSCVVVFTFVPASGVVIGGALDDLVSPTRDFVGFGTLTRCSTAVRRFTLLDHPSDTFTLVSSKGEQPIMTTSPRDRLLRFTGTEDLAETARQWFAIYPKYRMAITLFLAPLFAREMYLELRLATALMAIESYQAERFGTVIPEPERDPEIEQILERLTNEPALRSYAKQRLGGGQKGQKRRLREVVEHAGGVGDQVRTALPNFEDRLAAARGRNVAHGASWHPRAGLELHFLDRGLRWIFATCILRELGHSQDDATLIVRQCSRFSSDVAIFHHLGPEGRVVLPDRPAW